MPADSRKLPNYIQKAPRGDWILIEENKRSAKFRNSNQHSILIVHVDGGLVTEGERADYIVAHPKALDVVIELKGSDVGKAIRQIRATRQVWLRHELAGATMGALVVRGPGVHPKTTASIDRWQREFRKTFKMKLLVETRNRAYEFGEFLLPEASRA